MADTPTTGSPDTKQPASKPLAFIRFGLIEIIFVVTVLALFFGTLNYFNILSISKLNPQLFGRLPHKPYIVNVSPKVTIQTLPTLTPNNVKGDIVKFLSDMLVPTFQPNESTIDIKQDNRIDQNFAASWTTQQNQFSADIDMSANGKQINNLYLSFFVPTNASPSSTLAKTITTNYFSFKANGDWKCANIYESIYCESFWEDEAGTREGIGLQGPLTLPSNSGQEGVILFSCQHNRESQRYFWKSCTNDFANSGLQ